MLAWIYKLMAWYEERRMFKALMLLSKEYHALYLIRLDKCGKDLPDNVIRIPLDRRK